MAGPFPFFPDEFLGGTYWMTHAQVGLYVRALCHCWSHRTLPDDPDHLEAILQVTDREEFAREWPAVAAKFTADDNDRLYHPKLESLRADQDPPAPKTRAKPAGKTKPADDPELLEWITTWNGWKDLGFVHAGVSVKPSAGVLAGWRRVRTCETLRELLADPQAVEAQIKLSPFVCASWFRLEKLFGGKNKSGEYIAAVLMSGGYQETTRRPLIDQSRFEYDPTAEGDI